MRKIFLLATSLLLFRQSNSQTTDTIPFTWSGNHEALLLPVSIEGQTGTYYMQFDLGSPYTFFYKNALPGFADTLFNYSFRLHTMKITLPAVPVKEVSPSGNIIGTIGADLIKNKIAVFDYPGNRLLLCDSIPQQYTPHWQSFYFIGGRALLPAVIKGNKTILYFDTGSSAFALLTDSATALQLAVPGDSGKHYPVNSWGRILTAHTYTTSDSVQLGGKTLPLKQVSWISGTTAAQVQQMKQAGIGGMTGNRLFLHHVLILDTRRQQFALMNSQ